jgi:hypothetical protein
MVLQDILDSGSAFRMRVLPYFAATTCLSVAHTSPNYSLIESIPLQHLTNSAISQVQHGSSDCVLAIPIYTPGTYVRVGQLEKSLLGSGLESFVICVIIFYFF